VPLAPPKPHCTSDLQELTLVYIGDLLGQGCTVSNAQGGYADCDGVADPGEPVSITVGSGLVANPIDEIDVGDTVAITASGGGDLPWLTTLEATGPGGLQDIAIKTSCHKPLSLGDRFGAWVVFGMDREEDGAIALGGEVLYQYKVTNPNASTVDNVEVTDSELGQIASGVSIPPGGMVTFSETATLFSTTTNLATVTGDVSGGACEAASDEATVEVLLPPQGSFTCWGDIDDVTVVWDGTQTVDVKAWKGSVGGVLLGQYVGVAPGEAITVSGLGSSESTWEIFLAGGAKIGESKIDPSCEDKNMNGVEDCGKNEGNGKYDLPDKINTWLLDGLKDNNDNLDCTPEFTPPPVDPCGLGPELVLLMPGLMWLHRRRLRKSA
jgi:hypothetical protein